MKRVITVQDAVAMIPEGATIMIGGFMGCGNTHGILDALARSGKRGFTVICNDGAMLQGPDGSECYGVAKLIRNRQIKRLIATHVGLTPTGFSTIVEDSEFVHSVVDVDGKSYLLMRPLHADVALISGYEVDHYGNIWYKGTTRNFNQVMAMAADLVIVEADNLVEAGTIKPENVMTPGIVVDFIVDGGEAL